MCDVQLVRGVREEGEVVCVFVLLLQGGRVHMESEETETPLCEHHEARVAPNQLLEESRHVAQLQLFFPFLQPGTWFT